MDNSSIVKFFKEFALYFLAAAIGSIIYYLSEIILKNKAYSIIIGLFIALITLFILFFISFKKKQRLIGIFEYFRNFDSAPSTYKLINNAHSEIEFMGISARTFLESEEVEEILKRKIRIGVKFKFLMLDPDSKFLEIKAKDEGDDPEAWKHDINGSIKRLARISQELGNNNIEIRLYDALPVWRFIYIDHKIGYFTYYPHGHRGKYSPVFAAENRDGSIYEPLHSHFNYRWDELSKNAVI